MNRNMNNSQPPLWRGPLSPLVHLANNWISLIGVILVTTTTVFWMFLLPTTLKGVASSPYIGTPARHSNRRHRSPPCLPARPVPRTGAAWRRDRLRCWGDNQDDRATDW